MLVEGTEQTRTVEFRLDIPSDIGMIIFTCPLEHLCERHRACERSMAYNLKGQPPIFRINSLLRCSYFSSHNCSLYVNRDENMLYRIPRTVTEMIDSLGFEKIGEHVDVGTLILETHLEYWNIIPLGDLNGSLYKQSPPAPQPVRNIYEEQE